MLPLFHDAAQLCSETCQPKPLRPIPLRPGAARFERPARPRPGCQSPAGWIPANASSMACSNGNAIPAPNAAS